MTSSFLPIPKLLTAISNAAVPLDTQQENFLLVNLANFFSKPRIFEPLDDIQPLLTVS